MKTYIALFLMAVLPGLICAQSLERKAISSGGSTTVMGTGMQVSQTIGQPMIKSFTPGTLVVTEGFQQGSTISVSAEESLEQTASFTAYPNPVGAVLNLRIESSKALNLELSFYDVLGRSTTIPTTKVAVNGAVTETIDFSEVAIGTYILRIRDLKTGDIKTLQVRKVD